MATQDKAPKTKAANGQYHSYFCLVLFFCMAFFFKQLQLCLTDVNAAAEERKKMLARYKENKMLQKEKEKRDKEKKGVFKVSLYKPQPLGYLPSNTTVQSRGKVSDENNGQKII